jgi:hypothetical protein
MIQAPAAEFADAAYFSAKGSALRLRDMGDGAAFAMDESPILPRSKRARARVARLERRKPLI